MRLRQKKSVVEFYEEFDAIITRLNLSEDYMLSCFLGGLKHDIQMVVRMFQPTTVSKAFKLARLYEAANVPQALNFVSSRSQKGVLGSRPVIADKFGSLKLGSDKSKDKVRPGKSLTPAYMNERRAKGLCYFCDEPYSPEHSLTHKRLQVHVMEVLDEEEVSEDVSEEVTTVEEPQISVNALTGIANFRTMRVNGYHKKSPLHILIDSGSTHNFLDIQVAKKFGCKIENMDPVNVTVADGNKLRISSIVRNFTWTIQRTTFTSDMLLIPLGCCDLVLGVEWLIKLGNITWNFDKLTMEFKVQGKKHVLRGATSSGIKTVKRQQIDQPGLPAIIVQILEEFSDIFEEPEDPVFVSSFWQEFMAFQGIQVQLSSSYHPQTDGQSEIVNKCLETYLRCMCADTPHQWSKWLPLAEWWYNTTYHTAIKATPYEIMYGQPPPAYLPYLPGESKIELVDRSLSKREEMLKLLKFHLKRAQERMKQLADQHRRDKQYQIGDLVYVKLHPYRQVSVAYRSNAKLSPKFFGPYRVLDRIGEVAYKLELPPQSKVHNVFHVSQLKKHIGNTTASSNLPFQAEDAFYEKEPELILDRMTIKRKGVAVTKVLVKWKHKLPEDSTWEFYYDLKKKYPSFHP
uniref:Retrotransposable element Tf2 n=1 Tax=Cajanus cajan TaxID=3821 RepID=A0A151S0S7_CAJCA|nr:Retrotransposable element Tf2 [Cajanus cajan]